MENRAEDEIIKRWQTEAREKETHEAESRSKKRPRRAIEGPQQVIELEEDGEGSSRAVALSSRQHRLGTLLSLLPGSALEDHLNRRGS